MRIPDRLAQARQHVLTPELAAVVPSTTESAWSQLKEARGQAISIDRAVLLARHRDHIIGPAIATEPPVVTAVQLLEACADALPATRHQIARRGYPIRSAAGWLRCQILGQPGPEGAA